MLRLFCLKIREIWPCIACDEKGLRFSTFSTINENNAIAQASKVLRGEKIQHQKPDLTVEKNLRALADIYYGKPVNVKFNLCTDNLPEFTEKVLHAVMKIPRGYVSTYRIVAEAVSKPRAARAVGNAMAENPFTLIVPCHRVVPFNLTVGKYGLGSREKRGILEREGIEFTGKGGGRIRENFLYKF